jgi:hypothetical protein
MRRVRRPGAHGRPAEGASALYSEAACAAKRPAAAATAARSRPPVAQPAQVCVGGATAASSAGSTQRSREDTQMTPREKGAARLRPRVNAAEIGSQRQLLKHAVDQKPGADAASGSGSQSTLRSECLRHAARDAAVPVRRMRAARRTARSGGPGARRPAAARAGGRRAAARARRSTAACRAPGAARCRWPGRTPARRTRRPT